MPYKMTQHQFEAQRPPSPEDLKRVFEAAVCEIHQADVEAKERLRYRAPIVSRARILGLSQAGAEKRALSDAARALAQHPPDGFRTRLPRIPASGPRERADAVLQTGVGSSC